MAAASGGEAVAPKELKVYFAGSIRGGRADADLYGRLIKFMQSKCKCAVLTEHVGLDSVAEHEAPLTEKEIYDRDMDWLRESDCVVAEVTQPSLGVGYELAMAETLKKPTLCLFRGKPGGLSAMLTGCSYFKIENVETEEAEQKAIQDFLAANAAK